MEQREPPYYAESLAYISDDDVAAAYKYLVEAARKIPGVEARPKPHGYVTRNLHYFDQEGRSSFAFSVARKWLLFYLRAHNQTHPGLSLADLQADFADAAENQDNQFTFKIRNVAQAQATMRLVFGNDYVSPEISYPDEIDPGRLYFEGAARTVLINSYERNQDARLACLSHYGYRCSACNLSFEETYGPVGKDFIHVHHLVEISSVGKEYLISPVHDLRPVCANCHAMLHRRVPALTIEELKASIAFMKGRPKPG